MDARCGHVFAFLYIFPAAPTPWIVVVDRREVVRYLCGSDLPLVDYLPAMGR